MATARALELVVNPSAGGGRAGRVLGEFSRALGAEGFDVTVHRTGGRAQLADTVRSLVERGCARVGVMGGDGTFHDVARAAIDMACTDALYLDGVISSVLRDGTIEPPENRARRYASIIVVRRRR